MTAAVVFISYAESCDHRLLLHYIILFGSHKVGRGGGYSAGRRLRNLFTCFKIREVPLRIARKYSLGGGGGYIAAFPGVFLELLIVRARDTKKTTTPFPILCPRQTLLYTVDPETGVENPNYTDAPTGTWLLRTSIEITNGVTFAIKGSGVDGDCDEVRDGAVPYIGLRQVPTGGAVERCS